MPAPAKRAFIIHGYQGFPGEAWLPWLKVQLEKRGFQASLPAMPHPNRPTIGEWIPFIARLVGEPDGGTVLVGHSLGCQAVLRYLETLGEAGKSVGRTVLVAGRFPAGMSAREARVLARGDRVLQPWLIGGVDPAKAGRAAGRVTVILSDNDPYIPFGKARASFPPELRARIVVEHGMGHFNEDDRLTELPSALSAAAL